MIETLPNGWREVTDDHPSDGIVANCLAQFANDTENLRIVVWSGVVEDGKYYDVASQHEYAVELYQSDEIIDGWAFETKDDARNRVRDLMDMSDTPSDHTRVIRCSCGETFESEDDFERHKKKHRRRQFNEAAQQWLDEHVGGQLADWHDENRDSMGGLGAYHVAEHTDGIEPDPDSEIDVRDAAIQYCRDGLTPGNVEMVFYDQFDN